MFLLFLSSGISSRQNRPAPAFPHARRITCGKPVETVDKPYDIFFPKSCITFLCGTYIPFTASVIR